MVLLLALALATLPQRAFAGEIADQASSAVGGRALQALIDGLRLGLLVGLLGLGMWLVRAATGVLNLAHTQIAAFGAVVAALLNTGLLGFRVPLVAAALGGVIAGAVLSVVLHKVLWRPLHRRGADRLRVHTAVLALALLLDRVVGVILTWGSGGQPVQMQYAVQRPFIFGPLRLTPRDAVVTALAAVLAAAFLLALRRSRVFIAARAVSDNMVLATHSGIDVVRMQHFAWMLGGGLAALAGVLLALSEHLGTVMGLRLLLPVLAAVMLAGLSSPTGIVLAALAVGVAMQGSTLWFSSDHKLLWAIPLLAIAVWFRFLWLRETATGRPRWLWGEETQKAGAS